MYICMYVSMSVYVLYLLRVALDSRQNQAKQSSNEKPSATFR